jgi:hypothetical protein
VRENIPDLPVALVVFIRPEGGGPERVRAKVKRILEGIQCGSILLPETCFE